MSEKINNYFKIDNIDATVDRIEMLDSDERYDFITYLSSLRAYRKTEFIAWQSACRLAQKAHSEYVHFLKEDLACCFFDLIIEEPINFDDVINLHSLEADPLAAWVVAMVYRENDQLYYLHNRYVDNYKNKIGKPELTYIYTGRE
jgi:hypothetical protein